MTASPKKGQTETLQRVMTSFKNFEKKLDKLQCDISYHSQALSGLRHMVGKLAGEPDDNEAKTTKKAIAVQYEEMKPDAKVSKRKNVIRPLPNKLKAKLFQSGDVFSNMLIKKVANSKEIADQKRVKARKGLRRKAAVVESHKMLNTKRSHAQKI